MANKDIIKCFLAIFVSLGFIACTKKPDGRVPQEQVMHFPFSLALSPDGQTLLVASSATDGAYEFGRLVSLSTAAIKKALDSEAKLEPIEWSSVVKTNVLIPQDSGEISFTNSFVSFASRENNQIIAIPTTSALICNELGRTALHCPNAISTVASDYDPYAIKSLKETATKEFLLVSYTSSSRINLLSLDKAKSTMAVENSFDALDWLKAKMQRTFKHRYIITKKIQVSFAKDITRSKVYFLLEEHPNHAQSLARAKASYLMAIKVSDLLSKTSFNDAEIDFWDLSELFSIAAAQDFYLDEDSKHAYILARIPESLFEINLATSELIDTSVVCRGGGSMAVSKVKNALVVPCFTENRVALYSLSPLRLRTTSSPVGRGPAMCSIDEAHGLIYCTYAGDGILAIFDENLLYRGYAFPKAPLNRTGS